MKKTIIFTVILFTLILQACDSAVVEIGNHEFVNEQVLGRDAYNINIPIATTKPITNMYVDALNGKNTEDLEYEVEYYLEDNSESKGYYVYSFMLYIDDLTGFDEVVIETIDVRLDNQPYVLDLGTIYFSQHDSLERNTDSIIFKGIPVTVTDFDFPLEWDLEIQEDIKITKIYLSNPDLVVNEFMINGQVTDFNEINSVYTAGENVQILMDLIPSDNDLITKILGTDLIVEFEIGDSKMFSIPPVITRVYGSGIFLENYLK